MKRGLKRKKIMSILELGLKDDALSFYTNEEKCDMILELIASIYEDNCGLDELKKNSENLEESKCNRNKCGRCSKKKCSLCD